ncbi:hypothetical protein [Burkholderia cepacia]|uniref:Uncharacterized protein n=1 Tax=Burkholderia cepacia GG4 TaxID=1009846 RepID=A0A9W3K899_BURCE|nr:hypothetical protein [Burkholderia cepacia]AFQ51438.1 hypothetical protein GEM_5051 [Burkholderia cepacia GG4]
MAGRRCGYGKAPCAGGRHIEEEVTRTFVACGVAVARFGRTLLAVVLGRL